MDANAICDRFRQIKLMIVPYASAGPIMRELESFETELLADTLVADRCLVADLPDPLYEDTRHEAALIAMDRLIDSATAYGPAPLDHSRERIAEITKGAVAYANELVRQLAATDTPANGE